MEFNEQYRYLASADELGCTVLTREGVQTVACDRVVREHLMDVYINEQLTMKVICTPQDLGELVLGRLLSEGVIAGPEDVELIYICEHGHRAKVLLTDHSCAPLDDYQEVTPTCCTGNQLLNGDYLRHRTLRPVTPIHWESRWIFALADRFSADTPLHRKTGATHSCYLAQGAELLFSCEDIGRHNALDKALGYALRHDIDLHSCTLYSSGRLPTDMVEKAIRAGVPILCTKASPTAEAVDLAQTYGLTLLGVRSERLRLYSGSLR